MLNRRDCIIGSIGAGLAILGGDSLAAADPETVRAALRAAVGTRENVAGMIAVVIEATGVTSVSHGNSGAPNVALNGDAVFEIMSNTKVLTSLLLADMAARGEVAFDDPVSRYLPQSVTLHEKGNPITLIDLATYSSGLPNMPGNLPANWYDLPNPLADYTEAKLFEFLSAHVPEDAPGTRYQYANVGFGLLGIALARRAGKSYEDLLLERVCAPLGLASTRINLTPAMRRHKVQGHDLEMKPTVFWDLPAMPGAGCVRSTAKDLTQFVRACMGLVKTPLLGPMAQLIETQKPTRLAGTNAAMGWFVTADKGDDIVWKSGLSGGCNTFMGYSPRRRRGAVLMSNFLWQPIDSGTINLGVKLISPEFSPVDFNALLA